MYFNHNNNSSKIIFIVLVSFLISCNTGIKKPDTSAIQLEVTIQRFDLDLFDLKQNPDLNQFKKKYKDVLPMYSSKVIGLGDSNDPNYSEYLNKFLYDSTMTILASRVDEVFPSLKKEEEELKDAFKNVKFYYPNKAVPKFYTQISGFNQSIVVTDKLIGISLDKYLGKDCEFYAYLSTPMYARENMIPERISQDVVLAYALTEFPFRPLKDDLISNMIYQGKIRYFVQAMMPDKKESAVLKYSPNEFDWCVNNEELIWGYIIEQKHLFSTDYRTIIKYVNDGPFTPGMPQESPSRTGIWIGLQIVKQFMNTHEAFSLVDLMKENDYGMLLRESSYQP